MSKRHIVCIACMFEVSYIPLILFMYRYNMTSIFEVLPIEILQTEELTKATSQNMEQGAIAQSKREKKR